MLRITRFASAGDPETLKLEGRLAGAWVPELSKVVQASLAAAPRVVLDLSDVTFVDRDGVELLQGLRSGRAELRGGSAFVTSLMKGVNDVGPG